MMQPNVTIVILNWNGLQDTLRCIECLEQQQYPAFHILVVDNGSSDGSATVLRALGDRITLMEIPTNLGYTGGNNLAMQHAFANGADYVWLFNNDAVAERDTLARLIARCNLDPAIGLASPVVREADAPEVIQFAAGLFDLETPSYMPSFDLQQGRDWQTRHPDRIALVGTAMLIRRSTFEKIGLLDPRIFAYWEDIDYSIRSACAGFRNVMIFETSVYHQGKSTMAAPETVKPHYYYLMTRNEILMWRTFCTTRRALKAAFWVLRRQLRQITRMPDNAAGLDAVLAGLWDGLGGVGGGYDPSRRMPTPLRQLLGRHPDFWLRLIDAVR